MTGASPVYDRTTVTLGDISVGCNLREFEKVRTRIQTAVTGALWLRLREVVELCGFQFANCGPGPKGEAGTGETHILGVRPWPWTDYRDEVLSAPFEFRLRSRN